jgi:pyrroloquinoline quinone biosynthesis protein B
VTIRVLGSAAGGGVPQWNCACTHCSATRAGAAPRRTQSSIAFSVDDAAWYLLNVSPDVAAQIEDSEFLLPPSPRGTPIAGMLFTDANVDHMGGLAVLRQQGSHAFRLWSSEPVRSLAASQVAFAAFTRPPHDWTAVTLDGTPLAARDESEPFGSTLDVRPVSVPGTLPGYAGRGAAEGAVVAYACEDRVTGMRVLFAPVFAALDDALLREIARADVAFLDGSFYSDDELAAPGFRNRSARALGHMPVGGVDGSLVALRHLGNRRIYTHVNNTNPMLDPESPAAQAVAEAGAELAFDGTEIAG